MTVYSNHSDYFKQFDSSQMPILPAGVPDLLASLSNENIGYRELSHQLEYFSSISARLIALANSAWSSPVEPIHSIENACARLGLQVVRSVSIALAVSAPFDPNRCPAFDCVKYWADTLLTADIAVLLNEAKDQEQPFEASSVRAAALLHNLGLLFLVHHEAQVMDEVFQHYKNATESPLNQMITKQLGLGPCQVGALLAAHWGLPLPILTTMAYYDDTQYQGEYGPLVNTVSMAINCVSALKHDPQATPDFNNNEGSCDRSYRLNELWPKMQKLHSDNQALAQSLFS